MKALRFLKLLPLVVVLAISPLVVDLMFNHGSKVAAWKASGGDTKTEDAKGCIELSKELNDLLVKKWIGPALEKAIPAAVNQVWKEICEEFELKDEVEQTSFTVPVDDDWPQEGDVLIAWCVVKPGPKVLPPQQYRKQGDDNVELRFARVIAPVSKPLAFFLARSKDGGCRLCGSARYDPSTEKWMSQVDVLKGEKEEVRRAVADAVKGIDPGMVAAIGLATLNPPPASRSKP